LRRTTQSFGVNQEDIMKFTRTAAAAAILCLGLGASSTVAAEASVPANILGCFDMSKKTNAALAAGQQSPNYAEARAEASSARDYCTRQMYREGMERYARALKLLGAG
jgi:hypothetical protein